MSGAAKTTLTERVIAPRAAGTEGVFVGMAGAFIRGPVEPFLVSSPNEFLARTTIDGKVKVGYDQVYYEVLATLTETNKVWLSRAYDGALYGGAYARAMTATGGNAPASQGFLNPNDNYDMATTDGRPLLGSVAVTVDASQNFLTVPQDVYDMVDIGDQATLSTSGVLPPPLSTATTYYLTKSATNRKVGLATSLQNANLGQVVDLTGFGTGSHTLVLSTKAAAGPVNADAAANTLSSNAATYLSVDTGDRVRFTTSGSLPAPLALATDYYVIKTTSSNTLKVAASLADAQAGVSIDLTSTGSGTHTLTLQSKAASGVATADLSDDTFTANSTFSSTLKTGDAIQFTSNGGTLPAGLALNTTYYAIKLPNQKFKVASTAPNAANGVSLTWEDPGSGSIAAQITSIVAESAGEDKVLLFYGANPGKWNDELAYKLTNYVTNPNKVKEPGAFLLEIYLGTSLVDSRLCSRDPNKKDGRGRNIYVEEVLKGSDYLRAVDNVTIASTVLPKDQTTPLYLFGGSDGNAIGDGAMITAINKFNSVDTYPVNLLNDSGWTTPAYQSALITLAEQRDDAVVVLSTPFEAEASASYLTDIIDYKQVSLSSESSYAAMYSSHLAYTDIDNNRSILIAPSGHVSGRIAWVWDRFGAHVPVAGEDLGRLNVTGVHRTFSPAEEDSLYDANVNPIRWRRGEGVVIWGQKTLQTRPTDLDRLNARLALVVLKPALKKLLDAYLFSLGPRVTSDKGVKASIEARLANYLNGVVSRGGLNEYQLVWATTSADLEAHTLRLRILIKLPYAIEYIEGELGITPQGLDFALVA